MWCAYANVAPTLPVAAPEIILHEGQYYLAALKSQLDGTASAALIAASTQQLPIELTPLEAVAVVSYAWSVWLLARNNPLGWWIGLIGVATYAVVFYRVRLYAEVGIQVFYFFTSLQAIYIWLRGGTGGTQRPVTSAERPLLLTTAVVVPLATHVWHRRYVGDYCRELGSLAATCSYDLTILTAPDFAFVQDGTREGESIRQQMHEWFKEVLDEQGRPYVVVQGTQQQRLAAAIARIDPLLHFEPLAAP